MSLSQQLSAKVPKMEMNIFGYVSMKFYLLKKAVS